MNQTVRALDLAADIAAADFRDAMRSLAGGVSIITVGQGQDITGMTVTSVCSLSVEPPTLMVSVNRSSSSWPLLRRYGSFGVNIPGADQLDIAERFSGKGGMKGAARFNGATWTRGATGVPLLEGALAAIACSVEEIIERHSHAIVIGRVREIVSCAGKGALAYWDGQYSTIGNDEDVRRLAEVGVPWGRALRQV